MDKLKVGSEAIVVNSEEHSEWNFHKCKILSKEKDFIEVQIHEGNIVIEKIKVKPNELIPILYDKKEDIEKYGDLEHLYKLFSEYKGYYDCICKIADGECSRADKLAKENQNLQCEIDEMKKHLDCMKAEIGELSTRCHESAKDNFDNKQYGLIHIVGREELREDKPIISQEPIKVAEMLIDSFSSISGEYVHSVMENPMLCREDTFNELRRQEIKLLRQVAEHLLVYCYAEEN